MSVARLTVELLAVALSRLEPVDRQRQLLLVRGSQNVLRLFDGIDPLYVLNLTEMAGHLTLGNDVIDAVAQLDNIAHFNGRKLDHKPPLQGVHVDRWIVQRRLKMARRFIDSSVLPIDLGGAKLRELSVCMIREHVSQSGSEGK